MDLNSEMPFCRLLMSRRLKAAGACVAASEFQIVRFLKDYYNRSIDRSINVVLEIKVEQCTNFEMWDRSINQSINLVLKDANVLVNVVIQSDSNEFLFSNLVNELDKII